MPHLFTIIVLGVLFYGGFAQTIYGNDPCLGWGILVTTPLVLSEPFGSIRSRLTTFGHRGKSAPWTNSVSYFIDVSRCGRVPGKNLVDGGVCQCLKSHAPSLRFLLILRP